MQAHRNQHAHNWTKERVDLLCKLWVEGLSMKQIAKQLGDVSRNAVIGKVHRLGLANRAKPQAPPAPAPLPSPPPRKIAHPFNPTFKEQHPKPPKPPKPAIDLLAAMAFENGRTIGVVDVNDSMCKFPIGDPRDDDFTFCGRRASRGPYCGHHATLVYQPNTARKKREHINKSIELRRALKLQAAGF